MEEYICEFCNKICKNTNSKRQHEIRCKLNPKAIISKGNGGANKGNLDNNSIYESNLDRYYHPQCLFDLLDNPQSNPKKVDTAIALADYANEHKDDEAKLSTQNAIKMERAKTKSEVVKSIFKDIK